MVYRIHRSIPLCAVIIAGALIATLACPGQTSKESSQYFLRVEAGGHTSEIRKAVFTSDGQKLITVGRDKAVRIWDLKTGEQEKTMRAWIGPDFTGEIYAAALSPDGKTLAIGGQDYSARRQSGPLLPGGGGGEPSCDIRLFDLASGKITRPLKGLNDSISSLVYSGPDQLVSGSWDINKPIQVWDTGSGKGRTIKVQNGRNPVRVTCMAVSPDGRRIAVSGAESKVRILSAETGKPERELNCGAFVKCVEWSPDGALLAAGAADHKVHLWDANTYADKPPFEQTDSVVCLAFDNKGSRLLTGSGETPSLNDRVMRLWSIPEHRLLQTFSDDRGMATIFTVAFGSGNTAVSGDFNGVAYIWDLNDGKRAKQRLASTGSSVHAVAWSDDGKQILWGNTPGPANTAPLEYGFDLDKGLPAAPAPGANPIRARTSLPDGRTLTIDQSDLDNNAVVIRENGAVIKTIKVRDPFDARDKWDGIYCASFVDADHVIIGSQLRLGLYSVKTGMQEKEFVGHEGAVQSIAVTPDGKTLLSGSADQTVRMWNINAAPKPLFGERNAVEPLVSLFRGADGEWVTWTPEGYYSSSPRGDNIIGWQKNQGREKEAVFYTAAQLRERFYRPDALRLLRTAGSTLAALQTANKTALVQAQEETKRAQQVVVEIQQKAKLEPPETAKILTDDILPKAQQAVDDAIQRTKIAAQEAAKPIVHQAPDSIRLIPEIKIISVEPATKQADGSYVTDKSEVVVHVKISGGVNAADVRLSAIVNARAVTGARRLEPEQADPNEKVVHIHLSHSTINTIVIRGSTGVEGGTGFDDRVDVRCDVPATVDDRPNLYLLSVGVNHYADTARLPQLDFAARDAEQLVAFFKKQEGGLYQHVYATPLIEEKATKAAVHDQLLKIAANSKDTDIVMVFFACHGTDGDDPNDHHFCMAVADSIVRNPETMIDGQTILGLLGPAKGTRILMLDTCQSGTIGSYTSFLNGPHPVNIYSACRGDQLSYEDQDWDRHGAFTRGILEVLEDKSLYPSGGLTFRDLEYNVGNRVPSMVRAKKSADQDPQLINMGFSRTSFVIAKMK